MAKATIDHDEIRQWAEAKGGKPAAVDRTHQGGDVGIIRIMFPDNPQSEHQSLVEISWDEFFEQFEESGLALLYEEDSLFSKIIGRDTLERREHGDYSSRHHTRGHGGDRGQDSAGSSAKGGEESGKGGESRGGRQGGGSQGSGGQKSAAKGSGGKESDDLAAREYRDEKGEVHHHTRSYMEQHGGGKK